MTFIYGQLVFFKPAKTIAVQAKTYHPLKPGIFLDYYTGTNEKFTGQYIVADLEDFAHKNLHHRIGPGHFTLHLHRTEVVRPPVRACDPIFPLVLKYCKCNFTLEGIEAKEAGTDGTPVRPYMELRPEHDVTMDKGISEIHSLDTPAYKYSLDGRKLKVDENNVWIQRRKDWKPVEVPRVWWAQCPSMHDMWREMYPDPRRMPVADDEKEEEAPKPQVGVSSSSVPEVAPPETGATEEGDGVAEGGLFSAGPDDDVPDEVDPTRTKNYWQETPIHFIFWKVTPSMGDVKPYVQGPPNAPEVGILEGSRRHEATFDDDSTVVVEDCHDCKRSYPTESQDDWSRLQSEWTGRVAFRKMRRAAVIPTGSKWEPLPNAGDSNVAVLDKGRP